MTRFGTNWICRARVLAAWLLVAWGSLASVGAFTFTRTSSPVFYIDTGVTPTLQGMYVAYQINNNSATSYPDIWVRIDSFSGGIISVGPSEDGLVHLGAMAPGATKTAFFFLQASQATTTPQQHAVRVYATRPPAGELASQSFTMTVEETIQANANVVDTVVAGPNPPQLGGIVTVTVVGRSGTVGAARILAFNPAAYLSWRADAYELFTTTVTLSGGTTGTLIDRLYTTAASAAEVDYTASYSYRTVGTTLTPTPVSPISFVSSGTQIKHTRVNDYAQLDPILPAANQMTLGKTATPAQMATNGPVTFTLIATNGGLVDAILEDFVDTLPSQPGSPAYVAGSSRFNGVAIPDPLVSGNTLSWIGTFAIPAGTTRGLTFQVALPAQNGSYTNRVVAHIGVSQIDTTLDVADNAPAVAVVSLQLPTVAGFVYDDANRNLQRDAGEAGTGLSLFAKLIPASAPGGPAVRVVSVDPGSGAYSFTNVAAGPYLIVIDDNATASDVTPSLPAGWIGTEMPGQIRTNVIVTATGLSDQDFGLARGTLLSGRVFRDTGDGGGTANDGVLNGTEPALGTVTVRLTDSAGVTTYDSVATDGSGFYALFIPAAIVPGTALRVVETNPSGYLSAGATVGNTAGAYDRTNDTVSFTLSAGSTYTNVNFGDVPTSSLVPNGQQAGLPGSVVTYAHTFTAGSAGQVTFTVSNQPNPSVVGWVQVLYRDADCNGQLDPADPALASPIAVAAGGQICILVKESIPLTASIGAMDAVTVTALFDYLGASPALHTSHQVTDLTTVGDPPTAGLTLLKSADRALVKPGETITYTVTYANTSSQPLQNMVLYDTTPAYTRFLSATNGPLATNLTGVILTAPPVGGIGPLRWSFTGSLAPGHRGSVFFQVQVEP